MQGIFCRRPHAQSLDLPRRVINMLCHCYTETYIALNLTHLLTTQEQGKPVSGESIAHHWHDSWLGARTPCWHIALRSHAPISRCLPMRLPPSSGQGRAQQGRLHKSAHHATNTPPHHQHACMHAQAALPPCMLRTEPGGLRGCLCPQHHESSRAPHTLSHTFINPKPATAAQNRAR